MVHGKASDYVRRAAHVVFVVMRYDEHIYELYTLGLKVLFYAFRRALITRVYQDVDAAKLHQYAVSLADVYNMHRKHCRGIRSAV